jgi:membrane-associated phospholipid phosphatase
MPGDTDSFERHIVIQLKKTIVSFPIAALLILLSYAVLDKKTAVLVKKLWFSTSISLFSRNIPDFLPLLVLLITASAWITFFYLTRKGIYNTHARFFQLIAITVPLSNMVKVFFKFVFGRINTRFWLHHPHAREFHWFHGSANFSSFPSGHMAVFTVLIIALSIFYPRYKAFYFAFLVVLALALVVTNYHFVSDIIGGFYIGIIVHSMTHYCLARLRQSKNAGAVERG